MDRIELLAAAMKLSGDDRRALACDLLQSDSTSSPDELSQSMCDEIDRRVEAILAGRMEPGEDWQAVRQRLLDQL